MSLATVRMRHLDPEDALQLQQVLQQQEAVHWQTRKWLLQWRRKQPQKRLPAQLQ